jgi:DNA-binding PadR family transcriptional regulator
VSREQLLLGEWACLGIVASTPAHGFAVAGRLTPAGDVGRVWSLSRPLTYRALDLLVQRGLVDAVAHERGDAGPNRTVLAATRLGRTTLRSWLSVPVLHLRDLRSELLLKLVLADLNSVDVSPMLGRQLAHLRDLAASLADADRGDDVVAMWRSAASDAAVRFVERLMPSGPRRGQATARARR